MSVSEPIHRLRLIQPQMAASRNSGETMSMDKAMPMTNEPPREYGQLETF